MKSRYFDRDDSCKVSLAFSYDICNTKKGVEMTTPPVDSNMITLHQKLRVLADKYVGPMAKDWGGMMTSLRGTMKDMDWEEIKPMVVYVIVDGVELAHTNANCKPDEFPQCLHELCNRLAQGVEDMVLNMTNDDRDKINGGDTVDRFGYDMKGYRPDEDEDE